MKEIKKKCPYCDMKGETSTEPCPVCGRRPSSPANRELHKGKGEGD